MELLISIFSYSVLLDIRRLWAVGYPALDLYAIWEYAELLIGGQKYGYYGQSGGV